MGPGLAVTHGKRERALHVIVGGSSTRTKYVCGVYGARGRSLVEQTDYTSIAAAPPRPSPDPTRTRAAFLARSPPHPVLPRRRPRPPYHIPRHAGPRHPDPVSGDAPDHVEGRLEPLRRHPRTLTSWRP
ncbi:hypothetical protein P171DRAFT_383971 [Karstenula rhodostoma CBS 690.94]|uniref:Uncharacterized protein n=1 Tax=Karstenula rhodostoma CBS 690.94 TaxID=1392251 RepID=A0A9P4PKX3_9PLEO|nr:hypothetical protein P171DRAFT_383971 [Karstenula rhodostoma CBS 690.94]